MIELAYIFLFLMPYSLFILMISLAIKNELFIKIASVLFGISIIGFIYSIFIFIISTLFINY
jgi:hypothetical protein